MEGQIVGSPYILSSFITQSHTIQSTSTNVGGYDLSTASLNKRGKSFSISLEVLDKGDSVAGTAVEIEAIVSNDDGDVYTTLTTKEMIDKGVIIDIPVSNIIFTKRDKNIRLALKSTVADIKVSARIVEVPLL